MYTIFNSPCKVEKWSHLKLETYSNFSGHLKGSYTIRSLLKPIAASEKISKIGNRKEKNDYLSKNKIFMKDLIVKVSFELEKCCMHNIYISFQLTKNYI